MHLPTDSDTIVRILRTYIPAWSAHIGLSASLDPADYSLQAPITLSPISRTHSVELDGAYIAREDMPRSPREFIEIADRLKAGAVMILEIDPTEFRRQRDHLIQMGAGCALELDYAGSVSRKIIPRAIAHLRIAVFSRRLMPVGQHRDVALSILIPPDHSDVEGYAVLRSIGVPVPEHRALRQGAIRAREWVHFLAHIGFADRSEVLYLEEPDKPVHRKNSDRELEIISDSTDTQPDGNATQQQSGSSAGPEETTTNQSLWSQVPVDLRPLRLRHYRHFGSGQAARTLIAHARGRFLLLDASVAVPVSECMPLLDAMLGEDDGHPVQIRSASVGVNERTHKAVGTYPGPFWLWNRPAAELIYRQTRQNDRSQFLESLALLRKHRARIIWRHVAARSNDLARHQRIGALREWWRYHKGQLSVGLLLLVLIGAGIAIMLTLH